LALDTVMKSVVPLFNRIGFSNKYCHQSNNRLFSAQ
jgi:hypothetical protein